MESFVVIPYNHVHLLGTDQFDNHTKNANASFAALFGEEKHDSLFEGLNNVSRVIKIRLAMIEEKPYPFQQQRNHTENSLTNKKK